MSDREPLPSGAKKRWWRRPKRSASELAALMHGGAIERMTRRERNRFYRELGRADRAEVFRAYWGEK